MYDPSFRRRLRKRRQHITHDTYKPRTTFRLWFEFVLVLISWSWLMFIVFQVNPEWIADVPFGQAYGPFVVALAASIGSLFYFVTRHLRWSIMSVVVVASFTWLRLNDLDSLFHLLLLLGLIGVIEYVVSIEKPKKDIKAV